MKNAIVLISHSKAITDGLKQLIETMVNFDRDTLAVYSAGGSDEGEIGTTPMVVLDQFNQAKAADHVYVFTDMGSAVMSAETALSFMEDAEQKHFTLLTDAPLVEGAYVASVQCSIDATQEQVIQAVKEA
ncbi:MAG: dihydroxyacetone kinase phosphoryl donor subunit DhaM [Aerococcus sp.]|nr:dihydroxyacetone kinase phosphoryl donor subunit DhaM [Aerococcus sp.]